MTKEMDFYAMKRKRLQALSKKHGIPANLKNTEMARRLSLIFKGKENSRPCHLGSDNNAGIVKRGGGTFYGASGKDMLNVIILDSDSSSRGTTNVEMVASSDIVAAGGVDVWGEKSVTSGKISPSPCLELKSSEIERLEFEMNLSPVIVTENGLSKEQVVVDSNDLNPVPDQILQTNALSEEFSDLNVHQMVASGTAARHVDGCEVQFVSSRKISLSAEEKIYSSPKLLENSQTIRLLEFKANSSPKNRNDLGFFYVEENLQAGSHMEQSDDIMKLQPAEPCVASEEFGDCLGEENEKLNDKTDVHEDVSGTRKLVAESKNADGWAMAFASSRGISLSPEEMIDSSQVTVAEGVDAREEKIVSSPKILESSKTEGFESRANSSPENRNEQSNDNTSVASEEYGNCLVEEKNEKLDHKTEFHEDVSRTIMVAVEAEKQDLTNFSPTYPLNEVKADDLNTQNMVDPGTAAGNADDCEVKIRLSSEGKIVASPKLLENSETEGFESRVSWSPENRNDILFFYMEGNMQIGVMKEQSDDNTSVASEEYGNCLVEESDTAMFEVEFSDLNVHQMVASGTAAGNADDCEVKIYLSSDEKVVSSPKILENSKTEGFEYRANSSPENRKEKSNDNTSVASEEYGNCLVEEKNEKLDHKTEFHKDDSGTIMVAVETAKQDLTNFSPTYPLNEVKADDLDTQNMVDPGTAAGNADDCEVKIHLSSEEKIVSSPKILENSETEGFESRANLSPENRNEQSNDNTSVASEEYGNCLVEEKNEKLDHKTEFHEDVSGTIMVAVEAEKQDLTNFSPTYPLNEVKTDDLDTQNKVDPGTAAGNADDCEVKIRLSSEGKIVASPKLLENSETEGFESRVSWSPENRNDILFFYMEGNMQIGVMKEQSDDNTSVASEEYGNCLVEESDTAMFEVEFSDLNVHQMVASGTAAGNADDCEVKIYLSSDEKVVSSPKILENSKTEGFEYRANSSPENRKEKSNDNTSVASEEYGNCLVEEKNEKLDHKTEFHKDDSGTIMVAVETAKQDLTNFSPTYPLNEVKADDLDTQNMVDPGTAAGNADDCEVKIHLSSEEKIVSSPKILENSETEGFESRANLSPENRNEQSNDNTSVASEEYGNCLVEEKNEKLDHKTEFHEDVSGTIMVAVEAEKQDLTNFSPTYPLNEVKTVDLDTQNKVDPDDCEVKISLSSEEKIVASPKLLENSETEGFESRVNLSPENRNDILFFYMEGNMQIGGMKEQSDDNTSVASVEYGNCLEEREVEKSTDKIDLLDDVFETGEGGDEAVEQGCINSALGSNINDMNLLHVSPEESELVHKSEDSEVLGGFYRLGIPCANKEQVEDMKEMYPAALSVDSEEFRDCLMEEKVEKLDEKTDVHEHVCGTIKVAAETDEQDLTNNPQRSNINHGAVYNNKSNISEASALCPDACIDSKDNVTVEQILDEAHSSSFEDSDGTPVQCLGTYPLNEVQTDELDIRKIVVPGTAIRDADTCEAKFVSSQKLITSPASREMFGFSPMQKNNLETPRENDIAMFDVEGNMQVCVNKELVDHSQEVTDGTTDNFEDLFKSSQKEAMIADPGECIGFSAKGFEAETHFDPGTLGEVVGACNMKKSMQRDNTEKEEESVDEDGQPGAEEENQPDMLSCKRKRSDMNSNEFQPVDNAHAQNSNEKPDKPYASGTAAGNADDCEVKIHLSSEEKIVSSPKILENSKTEGFESRANSSPENRNDILFFYMKGNMQIGVMKEQSDDNTSVASEEYGNCLEQREVEKSTDIIDLLDDVFETGEGGDEAVEQGCINSSLVSNINDMNLLHVSPEESELVHKSEDSEVRGGFYRLGIPCANKEQVEDIKEMYPASLSVDSEEFRDCLFSMGDLVEEEVKPDDNICVHGAVYNNKSNISEASALCPDAFIDSKDNVTVEQILDEAHSSSFEDSDGTPVQCLGTYPLNEVQTDELDVRKIVVPGTAIRDADTCEAKFVSSQKLITSPASRDMFGFSPMQKNNLETAREDDIAMFDVEGNMQVCVNKELVDHSQEVTDGTTDTFEDMFKSSQKEAMIADPGECVGFSPKGFEAETHFDPGTLGEFVGACNMKKSMQRDNTEKEEKSVDEDGETGAEEENQPYTLSRKRKRSDMISNEFQPVDNAHAQNSNEKLDQPYTSDTASGDEVTYEEQLESPPKVTPTASSEERAFFSPKLIESSLMNKENINFDKKEQVGTITSRSKFLKRQPLQDLQQN